MRKETVKYFCDICGGQVKNNGHVGIPVVTKQENNHMLGIMLIEQKLDFCTTCYIRYNKSLIVSSLHQDAGDTKRRIKHSFQKDVI